MMLGLDVSETLCLKMQWILIREAVRLGGHGMGE